MSIIFGIRKQSEHFVSQQDLARLATATERFAADGTELRVSGRVGMGFQPLHTTERSYLESRPATDRCGNILTLDGRLDNYSELAHQLNMSEEAAPDSEVVLAAYRRWGNTCFTRLVGDWALAIWSATDRCIYLARDHAGTRTLYFTLRAGVLQWSTYLETLLVEPASYSLSKEYVACYLGGQPIRDLTPYAEIKAVPPAHFLVVSDDNRDPTPQPHWDWTAKRKLRYRMDGEYEEHFLSLFEQSITRRTRPGPPVLAQLSGGMDSSSIVCMSDRLNRSHEPVRPLLDTVSFYDDSEPHWNERPYFSAVETVRGKTGIHIDTSASDPPFEQPDSADSFYPLPGMDRAAAKQEARFHETMAYGNYRSILSGIGGDELLGGNPDPTPELADYLVSGNLRRLTGRAVEWCLAQRSPLSYLLAETVALAGGLYRPTHLDRNDLPPWMNADLKNVCVELRSKDFTYGKRIGCSPTTICNGLAWWSVMETLPHLFPGTLVRYEYRYPYLDRDLVEFLIAIPREQIVRPGRRRYLMRRALINITPDAVLERRRKAFISRRRHTSITEGKDVLRRLFDTSLLDKLGLIDRNRLWEVFQAVVDGGTSRWVPMLHRAIALEMWLTTDSARVKFRACPSSSDILAAPIQEPSRSDLTGCCST